METFDNDLREHLNYLAADNGLCFRCEINEVETMQDDNCRECINEIEGNNYNYE